MKTIAYGAELIRGIARNRGLLLEFAGKDFQRRFAGSYFGVIWGVLQPLLTVFVYWSVFQFAFKSGPVNGVPFVLWFMCGIVPWLFFAEAFPMASNCYLEYSYLVKKVVFNLDILPLVKIFSCMVVHLLFSLLILVFCIVFGYFPGIYLVQLLYYWVALVALIYAISIITSSIIVFFRDLNQLISIILLVGMWATPIAWNLSVLPEKYQSILKWNPIYYIVEGYRDTFVNNVWFWEKIDLTIRYWVILVVLYFIGLSLYRRLKPRFADVL